MVIGFWLPIHCFIHLSLYLHNIGTPLWSSEAVPCLKVISDLPVADIWVRRHPSRHQLPKQYAKRPLKQQIVQ